MKQVALALVALGVLAAPPRMVSGASVDDARLAKPGGDRGNWLTYNGQWAEQRFSSLDQIDTANVKDLRPVWIFATDSSRVLEATPLVVDGVLYTTAPWSVVFSVDAKSGKQLWRFDPKVDHQWGQKACCDVANRGVAVYQGKVFAGATAASSPWMRRPARSCGK